METDQDPTISHEPAIQSGSEIGNARIAGSFSYALIIDRGPSAGLTYVLGDGETLAGRSDDADIFLDDVTVSRRHARFLNETGMLLIEDLGSTNGTYINSERADQALLKPGDEVFIGKFRMRVVSGDE
tara:strand:+ start:327 stop:710 length:384 start_codon:yes stop_codon:yes gene_type:complete